MNREYLMELIKDWELAKKNLIIRLMPLENVGDRVLHRSICNDIAMCTYFCLENDNETASAGITEALADFWGNTQEEVFETAMKNTQESMMVITDLMDVFMGRTSKAKITDDVSDYMYVGITSKTRQFGASSVFVPGIADQLLKSFKCDKIYISFTSTHEAMVHGDDKISHEDLKSILSDTLAEATSPMDFLSEYVYQYDGREFSIAA